MENSKRLVVKIQQLEVTEVDAQQQIISLQLQNERARTQVDSLTSTVASQSSLIVELRKNVSDLTVCTMEDGDLRLVRSFMICCFAERATCCDRLDAKTESLPGRFRIC